MVSPFGRAPAASTVELIEPNGRTMWLDAFAATDSVASLRTAVANRLRIPSELLRLRCGTRELCDSMSLVEAGVLLLPVRSMLRVLGGKGGFGAMLRTAGKNGVKTTNFDACRDLNGRRLRHVNAEAKLREWEAQADERKRKKLEEKARHASTVAAAKPQLERFDDEEYEEMLETTRRAVSESVSASVSAAAAGGAGGSSSADAANAEAPAASGKRPATESASAATMKAAKLWADPLAGLGDDDSDSDASAAAAEGGAAS